MKKTKKSYYGPDWWDYPAEWDKQNKKLDLCQVEESNLSTKD